MFNEIVLPNGKVIVVDPYWYDVNNQYIVDNKTEAGKWVCGADYMILTHTHGDHVKDVPSILDYYPMCKVVVPQGGAAEFCTTYNINPMSYLIYAVEADSHLEFEDFTLDVIPSRHTITVRPGIIDGLKDSYIKEGYNSTSLANGQWGALHFNNYLITTKDGFKILLYGGTVQNDPYLYKMVDMQPDIMFYQAAQCNLGNPLYGTKYAVDLNDRANIQVDDLANFVASVNAGLCMPSHQEKFTFDNLNYIGGLCAEVGAKKNTNTQYFVPKNNTWYLFDKDKYNNMVAYEATDIPVKKKDPYGLSQVNSED